MRSIQVLEVADESPQSGGSANKILLDSGGSDVDANGRSYSEWGVVSDGGEPRRVCLGLRRIHDPNYGGVAPVSRGPRHVPTRFCDIAELVDQRVRRLYGEHNGYHQRGHHITVSKCGERVFGLLTMEAPAMEGKGWAIGWRGSVGQQLSTLVAVGINLWMCENMCLSGDAMRVCRKNTQNALESLSGNVLFMLDKADGFIGNMCQDLDAFKSARLSETRMAELVGRALYHGVVKSTQANRIFREIKSPTHPYTSDGDTVFDLYNHFTLGCKQGGGDRMFEQHGKIHQFHKDYVLELSPTQVQVPVGLPSPLDASAIHLVDDDVF